MSTKQIPDIDTIKKDAQKAFQCLHSGGVVILHYDVSYAVLCATDDALHKVYAAKNRSYDRASGVSGSYDIHRKVHVLSDEKKEMIRVIVQEHDLPLSVIAPFAEDDLFMGKLTPFLRGMATRDGTVNFLMNAGTLRDEIAKLSWEHQFPLIGSSANASLKGTKYRVEDIEPEVLAAADLVIDYGPSKHSQTRSLSSTQIDFRDFKVVRFGICYDQIADVLRERFGVELPANPYQANTN
ncbi:YrdC-like domain-containing protein [Bordetella tumbae]|uniref:Sua5/YciO/YrdC/YwlC family protein n=1 Tax=Bordetella tumbae TaxID=1649139 RepID=UPI0039EFA0AC